MLKLVITLQLFLAAESMAGAYHSGNIWPSSDVKVCWVTPDFYSQRSQEFFYGPGKNQQVFSSSQLQELIQKEINSQFKKEITGIHFTGWKPCEWVRDPDSTYRMKVDADAAILLVSKEATSMFDVMGGSSNVGKEIFHQRQTPTLRLEIPKGAAVELNAHPMISGQLQRVTQQEYLKMLVLHEFGHLSGLLHEHASHESDLLEDPHCNAAGVNELDLEGPFYDNYKQVTPYDVQSIMSYCQVFQQSAIGLHFFATPHSELQNSITHDSYRSIYQVLSDQSDSLFGAMPYLTRLQDQALYQFTPAPDAAHPDRVEVSYQIGLSSGDIQTLSHLYPQGLHLDEKPKTK